MVGLTLALALSAARRRGSRSRSTDPALRRGRQRRRARLGDRGGGAAHARGARRMGRDRARRPSRSSTWSSPIAARATPSGRSSSPSPAGRAGEPFAHMVENGALSTPRCARGARAPASIIAPDGVVGFDDGGAACSVALASGRRLEARLLVAADGVRSRLRDLAGISGSAGPIGSRASSSRRARARHGAAPRSISSPAVPSRSCRSPATALRMVWTDAEPTCRAARRAIRTIFRASSSGASAFGSGAVARGAGPGTFRSASTSRAPSSAALRPRRRRRARHPSDRRPGPQSRLPRRRGARRGDRRGRAPRPRHRLARRARTLRALAALRHARDGR